MTLRFLLVFLSALSISTLAQETNSTASIIENLTRDLTPRLARARYMEANPQKVIVPGWTDFPTMKYTYSLKDKATGATKTASVIMLNPDARQLARWIVTACVEAKGATTPALIKKMTDNIIGQSGGQFPVRGIVFEDILPENGIHEIYCFMDGVTVKIKGVEHRSEKQPTVAEIEKSLSATQADVTWVGKYARIQSTTRENYQKAGGKEPVDEKAWLDVNRKFYQKAWGNDRNELMIAWAKANL